MKRIVKPILVLTSILVVLFTGHFFVVQDMQSNAFDLLLLTYGFNFVITLLILLLFGWAFKAKVQQMGSIFLMSTGAKFLLFFTVIYPFLKMSGSVKSFSFAAFFIPYAVCLTAEVILAIRLMNGISLPIDENQENTASKESEN